MQVRIAERANEDGITVMIAVCTRVDRGSTDRIQKKQLGRCSAYLVVMCWWDYCLDSGLDCTMLVLVVPL